MDIHVYYCILHVTNLVIMATIYIVILLLKYKYMKKKKDTPSPMSIILIADRHIWYWYIWVGLQLLSSKLQFYVILHPANQGVIGKMSLCQNWGHFVKEHIIYKLHILGADSVSHTKLQCTITTIVTSCAGRQESQFHFAQVLDVLRQMDKDWYWDW